MHQLFHLDQAKYENSCSSTSTVFFLCKLKIHVKIGGWKLISIYRKDTSGIQLLIQPPVRKQSVLSKISNDSFKVIPTCTSTICSYIDFIACSWLCDCKLVILSVGWFTVVPQVHSQLIMTRRRDFMEVGETYNQGLICVSQEWGRERRNEYD